MIKQLLLVILAIVAIIAIRAAFIPGEFRVERSVSVQAPPEKIFPLINDFQQFGQWSPWEQLDPKMAKQISTPSAGKGAVYEWRGNSKAGAGRMEILESKPSTSVRVQLDRLAPIESRDIMDYTLTSAGPTTTVTMALHGPSPFVAKVMQVFVSMDDLVGKDFERGLAKLKSAAEKS